MYSDTCKPTWHTLCSWCVIGLLLCLCCKDNKALKEREAALSKENATLQRQEIYLRLDLLVSFTLVSFTFAFIVNLTLFYRNLLKSEEEQKGTCLFACFSFPSFLRFSVSSTCLSLMCSFSRKSKSNQGINREVSGI